MTSLPKNSSVRPCLSPRTKVTPPNFDMPEGSWDTHFHILGPQCYFPYADNRKYTPPDASVEQYRELQRALGLAGGWVVHANTHGFDNRVDLDAVMQLGSDAHVAVVRVDASLNAAQIAAWHDQGVRGVRFAFNPQHGGELDKVLLEQTVGFVRPYGWFIELHMAPNDLVTLRPWLTELNIPLVIDHMGRIDVELGTDQPAFIAMLDLLHTCDAWVKLSGFDRLTRKGPPYLDVLPFAQYLMRVAPERMLWGSDWPHTGIFDPSQMPNDGDLLNLIPAYAPSDALRRILLVDNPRRLVGIGITT
ncbi:amidohydrolase family protein [Achromobacter anxifer]|uniref:amidohydrolase family protein n=1 Tax=Achromobacter anxifer TaxID=1287737 RepID=UPI0023F68BBA|nr:amidohydrolase family protein [Achromobacter anxifer]MDF8364740.1 amidohydrolase family protein [Achromobacter anxifer]